MGVVYHREKRLREGKMGNMQSLAVKKKEIVHRNKGGLVHILGKKEFVIVQHWNRFLGWWWLCIPHF